MQQRGGLGGAAGRRGGGPLPLGPLRPLGLVLVLLLSLLSGSGGAAPLPRAGAGEARVGAAPRRGLRGKRGSGAAAARGGGGAGGLRVSRCPCLPRAAAGLRAGAPGGARRGMGLRGTAGCGSRPAGHGRCLWRSDGPLCLSRFPSGELRACALSVFTRRRCFYSGFRSNLYRPRRDFSYFDSESPGLPFLGGGSSGHTVLPRFPVRLVGFHPPPSPSLSK